MRFKQPDNQFTIYAVTGTYVVSFGIDPSETACKGLLGFSVKRKDETENEEYFFAIFDFFNELY